MRLHASSSSHGGALVRGRLLGRRKRFFVDVRLPDGQTLVCHCPNTGRLTGCLEAGAEVVVQHRDRPGRRLSHTWVLVRPQPRGAWVGVDSAMGPALVAEAIAAGRVPELAGFAHAHREVAPGPGTRIDLWLSDALRPRGAPVDPGVWVEVKSTTLVETIDGRRIGMFPDAPSERGRRHIEALRELRRAGVRSVLAFAIQRGDVDVFAPAASIDPGYAHALARAMREGVEVVALAADIRVVGSTASIELIERVPIDLDASTSRAVRRPVAR